MFGTSTSLLAFEEKETILEVGRFQCDTVEIKVRCGAGKCRKCNCSAWSPKSMSPDECICSRDNDVHSYNDHEDDPRPGY